MSTPSSTPVYWGWFVPIDQTALTAEQLQAYALPDYGGPRDGYGLYVDLYSDPQREQPVGRLWTAQGDRAGLLHVADEDPVEYASIALTLRLRHRDNVPAEDAFYELAGDYTAGPVFEGPLENIADPDQDANAGI